MGSQSSVAVHTKETLPYWPSISSRRLNCSPSSSLAVPSSTARLMGATIQMHEQRCRYVDATLARAAFESRTPGKSTRHAPEESTAHGPRSRTFRISGHACGCSPLPLR